MMQIHSPGCLLDLSVQLPRRGECGTRQTEQLANGRASRGTHREVAAVAAFCHRNHQFKVQRARFWGYETSLLAGASPWFSLTASRLCAAMLSVSTQLPRWP